MVTVRIKENSKKAREIIEMLRSKPFTEVIEDTRYNRTTEKVIADARAGKHLTHTTDHADLMEKLRSPL